MKEGKTLDGRRQSLLRDLPKIDDMLRILERRGFAAIYPREIVREACREAVSRLRERIRSDKGQADDMGPSDPEAAATLAGEALDSLQRKRLRRVVNATGVILHTNLGRAPLSPEALARIVETGQGYSNLEFDLETGERGLRYDHVAPLLKALTGAGDALAVNNNAAAVFLVLNTLAEGKEVIVSRGELVEIGGEFRVPDVMAKSGARLREVGTTNRTRIRDYEQAAGPETALLMKIHTSNFRMVGFTEEAPLAEICRLGREKGIPVVHDLGSGCLVELERHGLEREPTVRDSLTAGADIVTFSGDKLLGGPQGGIILGRPDLLAMVKRNPLNRALRIDKLTLAGLEATLAAYLSPSRGTTSIPALKALTEPETQVRRRARRLLARLRKAAPAGWIFTLRKGLSMAGGGSLPGREISTALIAVRSDRLSAADLDRRLRSLPVPVVARIAGDELLLDVRTVAEGDFPPLREGFASLAGP